MLEGIIQGITAAKGSVDLLKSISNLMPKSEEKQAVVQSLEAAARSLELAETQIAKSLGYDLCDCTFPPQIMLKVKVSYGHEKQCSKCKYTTNRHKPIVYPS